MQHLHSSHMHNAEVRGTHENYENKQTMAVRRTDLHASAIRKMIEILPSLRAPQWKPELHAEVLYEWAGE